jgi:hypothetical protein
MSSNAKEWLSDVDAGGSEGTSLAARDGDATLAALVDAGVRHAPHAASTHALRHYWSLLHTSTREERAALHAGLRERVRNGATTHRAWQAAVLGETDGTLVMAAVDEYLGGTPVSVAKRTAAIMDVIDWIRRALPLRRSAVYAALVDQGDDAILGELRRLRGLLSRHEAEEVWVLSAECRRAAACEFLADWRAALAG